MTQYFLYIIEASICLVLFYIVYLLFIKNDTFHKAKRLYLLASVVISIGIPILPSTTWTKEIKKTIIPKSIENVSGAIFNDNFGKLISNITSDQVHLNFKKGPSINLSALLYIFYFLGVAYMWIRLSINLYRIINLVKRNTGQRYGKYKVVLLTNDYPTFSFFSYIFLNDRDLNQKDKKDILLHEQTHLKQGHSLDNIFLEICKIAFWFNPIIWQYKYSLLKVHECLADEVVVKSRPESIQDYQSLLLNQYLSNINIELIHPFNYSLIKFRINMMTKIKSKWWAKYKMVFAIPIIVLTLVAFSNDRFSLSTEKTTQQSNLNQTELFKKFLGKWTFERTKDTTYTFVCKYYGEELDLDFKYITLGKIALEQKGLLSYDKDSDKFILASADSNNPPYAMWFTSKNVCEVGPVQNIANDKEVKIDRKWEFRSPDLLTLSFIVDNKYVDVITLIREKQ